MRASPATCPLDSRTGRHQRGDADLRAMLPTPAYPTTSAGGRRYALAGSGDETCLGHLVRRRLLANITHSNRWRHITFLEPAQHMAKTNCGAAICFPLRNTTGAWLHWRFLQHLALATPVPLHSRQERGCFAKRLHSAAHHQPLVQHHHCLSFTPCLIERTWGLLTLGRVHTLLQTAQRKWYAARFAARRDSALLRHS